MEKRRPKTGKG